MSVWMDGYSFWIFNIDAFNFKFEDFNLWITSDLEQTLRKFEQKYCKKVKKTDKTHVSR